CQPSGDFSKLGIGCDDAYLAQQAGQQSALSPRCFVNPHTGYYPTGCTTHPSGTNAGLLEVNVADLVITAGGAGAPVRYFCQHQYITADDALAHNQDNNASSREMATNFVTNNWVFKFATGSSTYMGIPAIRQWKSIDPGVVETDIDTPEDDGFPGLVIMAAKATDLGNGFWHYEYAVNNLNSDRSIASFSVPCSPYVTVQNIGFHDVEYRGGDGMGGLNFDGTDWPGTNADGAITWATMPYAVSDNANALRWGTLYNFRFDANTPPASGLVTLGEYKVVTSVTATTVIPSGVTCLKGDVNGDGLVDGADVAAFSQLLVAGGGTAAQNCAADVVSPPAGVISEGDIDPFVNCVLSGGCP
ncbi:MAG TPA: hypothetical protein VMV81_11595, partial [Phycisphaerae bacterium]|nr:hypothetical protein [Phycisphaerae bacterium]